MSKEITIDEVPRQILECAHQVEAYFVDRGVLCWALGGLQSRVKGGPPAEPEDPRVVDATAQDLVRAVMSKDNPPRVPEDAIYSGVTQIGLCCLGGRLVRLKLPNGRVLKVTLE